MRFRTGIVCCAWAVLASVLTRAQAPRPAAADQSATGSGCQTTGRVTSGSVALPGVSIVVTTGDEFKVTTSTDVDGRYGVMLAPNATSHLTAELTGFDRVERDLTAGSPPCQSTLDLQLTLIPRGARRSAPPDRGNQTSPAPSAPTVATNRPAQSGSENRAQPQRAPAAGRGRGGQRFQTLNLQSDANGAAAEDGTADAGDVARLLPPGFSVQSAQAEAIAIGGNGDATNLDRGLMNSRLRAVRIGELDPETGVFAGRAGQPGQPPGGFPFDGRGGGFGRGEPGGFALGGRGARGQSNYQGSATYTFGGSVLDSPPYQLRRDVPTTQPPFTRNNFGATFGGPLKIPRLYSDANRRTSFQVNYTGSQSNTVFDQYATVPSEAMRRGDFSASSIQLVDPTTGKPFADNQIPASRVDPSAAVLLNYIPSPNLPGTSQNYHVSTTARTTSDNFSLRFFQNLSPTVAPGAGPFGGGGGGGGRFGGPGGAGGRGGGRGTNVVLNAQLQYRRNDTESLNVFPDLGGRTTNTSVTAPITLNIIKGRSIQNITVNLAHARVESTNAFSSVTDVAGQAGITYPSNASTDPLNWGVPNLLFSGFTGVRGAGANLRTDNRLTASYMWLRPMNKHQLRMGGDFRFDTSSSESNANARGSFTFTGLYSSRGSQVAGKSGADFADFLLGAPQQATLQSGGVARLRQRSFSAFVEDNWQKTAKLTFNLGLRYELARPYVEANGRMTNLDVTPTFTAAVPVVAGGVGPFSGQFPAGLLNTDVNNVGPRIGVAYRLATNTVLRGGYGITYNSSSYASIARQLAGQPPFAGTETVIGTPEAPLTLAEALLSSTSTTTNNYGVDRDYALGMIQTWNATLSRDFHTNWTVLTGYTLTKGTNLDILRAPNRGPVGLLIPGVQAFTWESSGGHSILNAGTFQLRRKLASGIGGSVSYTLAKSMDNASSLGAGAPVVAQNDRDLASEWAVSSFDRRHQVSGDIFVELPFGTNRRWLHNGGLAAGIIGDWSAQLTFTIQSGSPLTARVLGAASDVSRGSNGSLRADYNGAPIQLSDPTVDEFFNVAAFSVPAYGEFGNSPRNIIVGPGGRQVNGVLTRDVRIGGNRVVSLQVNATNLFNTVQWASVDTNLNSPTFGQVLSARAMRTVTVNARFRF